MIIILIGIFLGFELYKINFYNYSKSQKFLNFRRFFGLIINLPLISTAGLRNFTNIFRKFIYFNIDHGWLEYYGFLGLKNNIKFIIQFIQLLSFNHVKIYLSLMVIWFVYIYLFFYLYSL